MKALRFCLALPLLIPGVILYGAGYLILTITERIAGKEFIKDDLPDVILTRDGPVKR